MMIDSGVQEIGGPMRGQGPSWRGPSTPYAIVALDELDLSDLENVDFEQLRPLR